MKRLILILFVVSIVNSFAQTKLDYGIQFYHGTWKEACDKAKAENKLIFVDFYTKWCGPCLNMAENVFILPFIGDFYNTNFVNMKIDAENGEGVELAKRYGVNSYPTYVFVDPKNGDVVHRSKSRQEAEQFLTTGKSALVPELRSGYLIEEFAKGRDDREFLKNYIHYNASIYERENVQKAFEMLIKKGAKLTDSDVWDIFKANIRGTDNPYFQELVKNYDVFVKALGKEVVDNKLYMETRNISLEELNRLPEFKGKSLNKYLVQINALVRDKKYDETDALIRATMADTSINQQDFIEQLRFIVRGSYWSPETPVEWLGRCVSYLQYIAYNSDDRQDPYIHQEYAALLERLIRLTPGAEKVLPKSIMEKPEFGAKEYSMRPKNLAQKPTQKKK